MHYLLLGIAVLALIFGPQMWARYTFAHYNQRRDDFPGTGGELARHLINRYELSGVQLETTPKGDHYDPIAKTVRLSPDYFNGKSLTAIAIAAHEVGHAMQHADNDAMFTMRSRLAQLAMSAERFGSFAMIALPVIAAITRAPSVGVLMAAVGLGSMLVGTAVHLVTLPVELDASFKKALPILESGNYVNADDIPAVRKILRAAAFTYVANSLANLLNVWRWIALLRRR